MRSATAARTLGSPLITRDTVDFDTPAVRATSSSVGRCPCTRSVNSASDSAQFIGYTLTPGRQHQFHSGWHCAVH